ncbi:hypothetical protein K440DRAFT_581558 [Wilcoxina mikolae CBS 423.85]|nr:hypothetical protein K440DRAFT_581558 [Wilcoxina mikolae CBS 423.85]
MDEMKSAVDSEEARRRQPPATPEHLNEDGEDGKQTPKTGSTTLARMPSHAETTASSMESFEDIVANLPYLQMLPIKVECSRGAVIMGNNNTPSILVAHFEKALGTVDARKSRSIDKYTQIFDLSFTHPTVQLKPNTNYKETLLSRGAREQVIDAAVSQVNATSQARTRRQRFRDLFPLWAASVESFTPSRTPRMASSDNQRDQWIGLSRYLDQPTQLEGWKFEPEEYAASSDILDCQEASFCLYWDVVGTVPVSEPGPRGGGKERNGCSRPAPEFGLDLSFTGGTINYGPWADRQRIHLQNMFFPKLYKTAKPAQPLAPGEDRAYTEFKLFLELSSSTVLKVPVREESKDWKYRRRLEEGEVRPFGLLEVKLGSESTLTYNMAYVASSSGWTHTLDLELRKPEVRSSVNNDLLWNADVQTLQCDLSGPLKWNEDTKWIFNNISSGMRVFLLREHVTLLTDLVTDWTSGPGQEYWTFVPMVYELNLKVEDSQFYFNINEQNIINNPSSFEDNTFIVLRNMGGQGGHLKGSIKMDFREFHPQSSVVEFTVETVSTVKNGGMLEVGVRTPVWNTWNCSLKQQESLGKVEQVKLKGSYEFFGNTSSDAIDKLTLDLDGERLKLTLHGFLMRYFLTLKENYFGENLHFKTLDEWQVQEQARVDGISPHLSAPFVKSNDLDIVLGVKARDLEVLLLKHIYEAKEHLRFDMPSLNLDMRFTNYYMDLQVDLAPISAFLSGWYSKLPEVFVDGITIFGHRLFGLPPAEPTYVCNWDLSVGAIAGECSFDFLQTSIFAMKAFGFSIRDIENALPLLVETIIHDVTFIRLSIASIRLWLHTNGSSVFRLAANEVSFILNDLADEVHSERITLKIPGLNITVMDLQRQDSWSTKGYLETEVNVTMLNRTHRASNSRRLQQKHIRDSDRRTGRATFLLSNDERESRGSSISNEPKPASMALPELPFPLHDSAESVYGMSDASTMDSNSSRTTRSASRKSSRSFIASTTKSPSIHAASLLRAASSHAPSFYSAVESLSDLQSAASENHAVAPSASPTTTTTPRSRSSLRVPTPTAKSCRHVSLEMTSRPLGVTLSSPFSRPKFPLDDIEPDLARVPVLGSIDDYIRQAMDNAEMFTDEESSRDSVIIEFLPGIRGFCTPSAVKDVASLLEHIQPRTPDDVLDFIQVSVVSKLAEVVRIVDAHGKVLEVCLRLPQFKFCFTEDVAIPSTEQVTGCPTGQGYALYLHLRNLHLAGRSKKDVYAAGNGATGSERTKSTLSVHVLVDSLDLELKDLASPLPPLRLSASPALGISVGDLLFWASTSETSTASLQLKTLAASVQGSQSLFLYSVMMRIAEVAEQIVGRFSALASLEQRRIQHFLSTLATAGEERRITQDPATLTRPSYVLRSATSHVRLNDSWKISARLRHIWQLLPQSDKENWTAICLENARQLSRSAKDNLISVFQRWRGWELGNIKDSIIIKQIFGEGERSTALGPASSRPLNAKVTVESIRLLVDPGPTQHEFVIDQLNGSVVTGNSVSTGTIGDSTTVVTPGFTSNTIVQIHSRSIRLGARWEALDILETLAKGLQHRHKEPINTDSPSPSLVPVSKQKEQSGGFHLIFTADHGSLSLDTVKVRVVSMVQDVRATAILSEKDIGTQGGKLGNVGSLLLRADHATLKVCVDNKILSKAIIRTPSLYGYFDEHWLAETKFHLWKVTGSSEEISLDIREQVLGLMEVVDFIVADELTHIRRLMDHIEDARPSNAPMTSPGLSGRKVHMIYCTLSLDQFSLKARLLPSLGYMVRGGGVRLSAKPNSKNSKEMIVDFLLEHHEHEICKSVEEPLESRVISLLQLPAINASFRDCSTDKERLVKASVSVEAITLDASSIQSLLNAIKKPEVLKVVENARSEWRGINAKLDEIFDHQGKSNPSKTTAKPLVYHADAEVSGLKIETLAPSANLEVNLGFIRVHASNRPTPMGEVLSFPDIRLEFGKITVELTRTTGDGVRDVCGSIELRASLHASSQQTDLGKVRALHAESHSLKINLFAETASAVVDVVGHLQDKLRDLDLSREVKYLRKLRNAKPLVQPSPNPDKAGQINLFNMAISMDMIGIQVSWIVGGSGTLLSNGYPKQNLVFSFKRIHFSTATRRSNEANLIIEEFLLQMVDANCMQTIARSENSALMPEVTFKVAYSINSSERRLAFQAKGRSLDLRLTSDCVVAANSIQNSITTAVQKFKDASSNWKSIPTISGAERTNMFSTKRLASVLVDADFAGAVVYLSSRSIQGTNASRRPGSHQGNYGQFAQGETGGITVLKTPGLAFKVEYSDPVDEDPSLSAEIKISASNNTLYPSVVPLIIEMSDNIKDIMKEPSEINDAVEKMGKRVKESSRDDRSLEASNPAAILGKCRLNVGLRICKQEFTLSCQPIARVAASAGYDQIYATISTCDDSEGHRFYATSATITRLKTSLQHVYSRESTGTLEVEAVTLSLMNNKHVMGSTGLSCMMKSSPIKSQINIKQFQDFLLFREIWYPAHMRGVPTTTPLVPSGEPSPMLAQRFHKVAATNAFPWNTTLAVAEIELRLDLGQSLGKSALLVSSLWVTSRKTSDWEQTMCLGFDSICISSSGRLSGCVDLKGMKVRTSINWDSAIESLDVVQTPLVEASIGFGQLQAKIAFDYQAFLLANIGGFNFLMYNLQDKQTTGDRLVGVLDGDKVQIFCTTVSAAQGLSLYQACQRLAQDKMASFEVSLKEVENFLNRRSQSHSHSTQEKLAASNRKSSSSSAPSGLFKLHTDVVVNLKEVNFGVFPSTFYDSQVFKLEALNATARFEVNSNEKHRIHSMLEMTLGELSIALSPVKQEGAGTTLADVSVEKVIDAIDAGKLRSGNKGIILRVPHVTALMHTWHSPGSMVVDFIFKSSFEGKVDVGWNFQRVGTIKNMYQNHVRTFAHTQGRAPVSSRISMYTDVTSGSVASSEHAIAAGSPVPAGSDKDEKLEKAKNSEKGKIMAVVDVPQSKYEYNAIEPPIIETPQLRDMGEATPPMEWVGLHRERLPHLTHQIVIVSLLEIAREVEDAYSKILGSS